MITGLTNLGPSFKGPAGLGAENAKAKGLDKPFDLDSQKQTNAESFDNVLKSKVSDNKFGDKVDASEGNAPKAEPRTDRAERIGKKDTVIPNENGEKTSDPNSEVEASENMKSGANTGNEKVRQQAMLQFMDSMENEFGIPPEEIVEAMTEMPTDQALKSPEQTASQVIGKLDLPAEDEQRALELYLGMLEQLKQAQTPTLFPKAPVAAAGMLGGGMMLKATEKRQALNHSLDRMNEQFFLRGQFAPQVKPQIQPMQQMMDHGMMQPEAFGKKVDFMPQDQMPAPDFEMPVNPKLSDANNAIPLEGMEAVDPESSEAKALLGALVALGGAAAALEKGLPKDSQTQQALRAEQLMNQLKADGLVGPSMSAVDSKAIAGLGLSADGGGETEDQGDLSSADEFFVHQDSQLQRGHQRDLGQVGEKDFATALGGASVSVKGTSNQQEAANAQRLMNQAQYLLKKGGGEAKIQMAPEGIGQVHLKMTLLDGKVNLEMQAESKEAKKLIESSIGELKTQLGYHNLTVDKLKVDVGNNTQMDTRSDSQQRSFDSQQGPSKDQTRNFWNQFNGNGTGGFDRRNGFNENTGIRAYGGTKRAEPLKAVDSNVAPASRPNGSGKGRGLNLVA